MMRFPCALLALAACSLTNGSPAMAQMPQAKPLSGTYLMGSATMVDPPPGEPANTHVRFQLEGRAAADIYRALPGRALPDGCLADGSLSKRGGDIVCTQHPDGAHACWFGLDLRRHRLAPGQVC